MEAKLAVHGVGHACPDEVKQGIRRGLKAGLGLVGLAKAFGTSTSTVELVREEYSDELPDWRKATKMRLKSFLDIGGERLVKEVAEIPIATLPVSIAIVIDKLLLLEGEATTRIEHVTRNGPAQFKGWIDGLAAPKPHQESIEAQVVDSQGNDIV